MNNKNNLKGKLRQLVGRNLAPYPYRRIEIKHHFIFIHIPKNAGTSILEAMGLPTLGRRHLSYVHYKRSDASRFDNFFKFAVVRDPVERAISLFKYIKSGGNQLANGDLLLKSELDKCGGTFDSFVDCFLTHSNVAFYPILAPQASYICDERKKIQVNALLRYETLLEDYKKIQAKLSFLPQMLPTVNRSVNCRVNVSRETIERVKQIYKIDFELFYG